MAQHVSVFMGCVEVRVILEEFAVKSKMGVRTQQMW